MKPSVRARRILRSTGLSTSDTSSSELVAITIHVFIASASGSPTATLLQSMIIGPRGGEDHVVGVQVEVEDRVAVAEPSKLDVAGGDSVRARVQLLQLAPDCGPSPWLRLHRRASSIVR